MKKLAIFALLVAAAMVLTLPAAAWWGGWGGLGGCGLGLGGWGWPGMGLGGIGSGLGFNNPFIPGLR